MGAEEILTIQNERINQQKVKNEKIQSTASNIGKFSANLSNLEQWQHEKGVTIDLRFIQLTDTIALLQKETRRAVATIDEKLLERSKNIAKQIKDEFKKEFEQTKQINSIQEVIVNEIQSIDATFNRKIETLTTSLKKVNDRVDELTL